jgi:hypothetical protein
MYCGQPWSGSPSGESGGEFLTLGDETRREIPRPDRNEKMPDAMRLS